MDVQALGQLADMQGGGGQPMEGGGGGPPAPTAPTGPPAPAAPSAGPPQGGNQQAMQQGLQQMMQGIQLIEAGVSATADPELYRMIIPMLEKASHDVMAYIGMGPQFDEALKHEKAMRSQQLQGTMMAGQAGPPEGPPPGPPPQQGPLG